MRKGFQSDKVLVAIVSGGFDPIHVGHIDMINECRTKLGADRVMVILNTDEFLMRKKGYVFMKFDERKKVLENIKGVNEVVKCIDKDQTVCETLAKIKHDLDVWLDCELIFANGGDRTKRNIPELAVCDQLGIRAIFGIGGTHKAQSSSELVKKVAEAKKKPLK